MLHVECISMPHLAQCCEACMHDVLCMPHCLEPDGAPSAHNHGNCTGTHRKRCPPGANKQSHPVCSLCDLGQFDNASTVVHRGRKRCSSSSSVTGVRVLGYQHISHSPASFIAQLRELRNQSSVISLSHGHSLAGWFQTIVQQ